PSPRLTDTRSAPHANPNPPAAPCPSATSSATARNAGWGRKNKPRVVVAASCQLAVPCQTASWQLAATSASLKFLQVDELLDPNDVTGPGSGCVLHHDLQGDFVEPLAVRGEADDDLSRF